jgi:hypothetical protein
MRISGSGTASAGAGSGNEGNKATKNGGMIGIKSPGQAPGEHARGFSGSRTRLQWSMHPASAVWVGVVCSSPGRRLTFSEKSREIPEPVAKFWDHRQRILGILHHQTASFAGSPITTRERCHVTQPRARINVSCSRADHM